LRFRKETEAKIFAPMGKKFLSSFATELNCEICKPNEVEKGRKKNSTRNEKKPKNCERNKREGK
jgi:hypothetical protein